MIKKLIYKNATLNVSDDGKIYDGNMQEIKQDLLNGNKRAYINVKNSIGKWVLLSVPRLVLMAFEPCLNAHKLQAGHIDDNPLNNNLSNLKWLTRKENNSTLHKRRLQSKNHKYTNHDNLVVKATNIKTGNVRYFANAYQCAQHLDCSHVLVYRVLNHSDFAQTAKKHKLEYVKNSVEIFDQIIEMK